MADKNNENKYLLLSHNNPLIKTIADFMESERIYEIGDDGKVLPDSQAIDKFFDFNREFIWK